MTVTFALYDEAGCGRLGRVTAPHGFECGHDFCDGCGDCLACYSGDWCPDGGHYPVVYEDALDDFLNEHEGAYVERTGTAS